jgi:uncharacterized protein (TIGR03086 family)
MVGLPDASSRPVAQDGPMGAGDDTEVEWERDVQRLLVLGRDREAAEVAARHLTGRPPDRSPDHRATTTGAHAMGPLDQLDELGGLLGGVAAGIRPDQLGAPTPCAGFRVRDVLGHLIGGAHQLAAGFRGEEPTPLAGDPAAGDEVVERAGAALGELMGAIRSPGALDRTIASPFGELSGEAFARYVVLDGLVHGWDLATATGQDYRPSDELVAEAQACAQQMLVPAVRDGDTFADATEPPPGATPIERLAAFTGRTV